MTFTFYPYTGPQYLIIAFGVVVIGGLGSAVAEVLVEEHPVIMRMIGVRDVFGESGSEEELFEKHGLTASNIETVIREVMDLKLRP